jgi:hypothetical protein
MFHVPCGRLDSVSHSRAAHIFGRQIDRLSSTEIKRPDSSQCDARYALKLIDNVFLVVLPSFALAIVCASSRDKSMEL